MAVFSSSAVGKASVRERRPKIATTAESLAGRNFLRLLGDCSTHVFHAGIALYNPLMADEDILSAHDLRLIEGIAAQQRKENEKAQGTAARRLEAARLEARRLASLLAEMPDLHRVVLFGSTASGFNFGKRSDIDLAIEGGEILAAMDIVEASPFKVDVVSLLTIHPVMRARIEKEGIVLYGTH